MQADAPAAMGLGEIARELDAAIGDHRNIGRLGGLDGCHDGCQLRHAYTGHDAGGADRAWTDTDLDGIRTGINQCLGAAGGGDIAGHDTNGVRHGLDLGHRIENALRMAMCGIDDDQIDAGIDQPLGPLDTVITNADGGGSTQTALRILRRIGVELRLFDILDGDETNATAIAIDHQQLLDAMRMQEALGFLLIDILRDRDQVFAGHQFVDLLAGIGGRSARRGW